MKPGVKKARIVQMVGAVALVVAIAKCSNGGLDGSGAVGGLVMFGLAAIIGARVYEFLNKE